MGGAWRARKTRNGKKPNWTEKVVFAINDVKKGRKTGGLKKTRRQASAGMTNSTVRDIRGKPALSLFRKGTRIKRARGKENMDGEKARKGDRVS